MDGYPDELLRRTEVSAHLDRATRVSDGGRLSRGARAAFRALACVSLGLSAVMSTGCLITDPPQFKPAKHTRPWLNPITADPDPRTVLVIDGKPGETPPITFSAEVQSQDDEVGDGQFQRVETQLYIDLGFNNTFDPYTPYAQVHSGTRLESGSLDQTGRRVSATWHLTTQDVSPGCHRATLLVSHIFDNIPCPVCPDDFTAITWQILRCDKSNGDCDSLPVAGAQSCEDLTNSCATVRAELADKDGGVRECPSDAADAGAP
jgi:hypothetical protein